MAKVYLISRTQPDLSNFLTLSKEILGRRVSNLSDSKTRSNELQRYALMLSEAMDAGADDSILENLGPVLSLFSFTFLTVVLDVDIIDLSTLLHCTLHRVPAKISGYSMLILSNNLRGWREDIIDSLSNNMTDCAKQILTAIHDIIREQGFSKMFNFDKDQRGILTL